MSCQRLLGVTASVLLLSLAACSKPPAEATSKARGVPPISVCGEPATRIHAIQGSGNVSPLVGHGVVIEAVVVGDYQETADTRPDRPELGGFYVQEEDSDADGNPATSEGLFVYDPAKTLELRAGDLVRVGGTVDEFNGQTQIDTVNLVQLCDSRQAVTAAVIDLPVSRAFSTIDEYFERFEGMLTSFADTMTVTEQFELARYGEVMLSEGGRLRQYGQDGALPLDQAGLDGWLDAQARRSILLDDFNTRQNIDPVFHPQPDGFAVDNYIRTGAAVQGLRGVLAFAFDQWRLQPLKNRPVDFANPPRPELPGLAGNVYVAAMNVLNYFNGDGRGGGFPTARGADSRAELDRQTDKLVAAIAALDADVLGLMEIENDGDGPPGALAQLVAAINAASGPGRYDYVRAGANGGTDDIKVSLIYKAAVVKPVGAARVLAGADFTDPNNVGSQQNRPALAQTFQVVAAGNPDLHEAFTTVVLHLKSKGSACGPGDDSPVEGNCSETRARAVPVLLDWLATDPTDTVATLGKLDSDTIIMGDFNAYFRESPMQAFYRADYQNLLPRNGHSFVFAGASGSLDHAVAAAGMRAQVVGSAYWHINADENRLLDYNDRILDSGEAPFEEKPSTNELYAPNAFRSSDHDPIVLALDLYSRP